MILTHVPDWIRRIKDPPIDKSKEFIPVYAPSLDGNEKKYEEAFAGFLDASHTVSTSSGTAALFLALRLLGIRKGDEVIVPSFTMISTALVVNYVGAKPVFADCSPGDGNITAKIISAKKNRKTKAVMPVHIYGIPCDMDSINRLAKTRNLFVIEDAAEALGSRYHQKKSVPAPISPVSQLTLIRLLPPAREA